MSKYQFNKWAVSVVKEALHERGFKIEDTALPAAQVSFVAVSSSDRNM